MKPNEKDEKRDCMPDVLKAIRCVKNKDMDGVRSANKECPWRKIAIGDTVEMSIRNDWMD
jgi:hypothetical protein